MPGQALDSGSVGFVGWLTRLQKPIDIVAVIVIFASTAFIYWTAGHQAGNAALVGLITAVASLPHRLRQIKKRQRGLEILNRFAPEQRAKPKGL